MLNKFVNFETKVRVKVGLMRFRKKGLIIRPRLHPSSIFVFLGADYGNLGDGAITYAQIKFLEANFPSFDIVEIPISKTIEGIYHVKKIIRNSDIVTSVGGGNFGNIYTQIETLRQYLVKQFPKNRIVSFPQTFHFTSDKTGVKALLRAQRVYSKHKDLILVAREEKSFELMLIHFPMNKVVLTPDIVLSLNKTESGISRKGVIICMRNDSEKMIDPNSEKILYKTVLDYFGNYDYYDTHIGIGELSNESRLFELERIWTAFRKAELVITDRLHGMIFCYITNTPCIVLPNNNHKIEFSYQWIKSATNIFFLKNLSQIDLQEVFRKLSEVEKLPQKDLTSKYNALIRSIKE